MIECCCNAEYLALFRGDDSDFPLNQEITIRIDTDMDISGYRVFFEMLDVTKELVFDENGDAPLVFTAADTADMPIGFFDASIYLLDADNRRRTLSNRLAVKVTTNVAEAYNCNITIGISVDQTKE